MHSNNSIEQLEIQLSQAQQELIEIQKSQIAKLKAAHDKVSYFRRAIIATRNNEPLPQELKYISEHKGKSSVTNIAQKRNTNG